MPARGWYPCPTISPSLTNTHPTHGLGNVFPFPFSARSSDNRMNSRSCSVTRSGCSDSRALEEAHSLNSLHRDVETGNVGALVDVRKLDCGKFGSARAVREQVCICGSPLFHRFADSIQRATENSGRNAVSARALSPLPELAVSELRSNKLVS